jgi:hypothetical protein
MFTPAAIRSDANVCLASSQALALAVYDHGGQGYGSDEGDLVARLRDYEPNPYAFLGDHRITYDSRF